MYVFDRKRKKTSTATHFVLYTRSLHGTRKTTLYIIQEAYMGQGRPHCILYKKLTWDKEDMRRSVVERAFRHASRKDSDRPVHLPQSD